MTTEEPLSAESYPYGDSFRLEDAESVHVADNGDLKPSYPPKNEHIRVAGSAHQLALENSQNISELPDVQNQSYALTQTNNSNQPKFRHNAIDHLPAVRFDGGSQYMQTSWDTPNSNRIDPPFHVFITFRIRHFPWDSTPTKDIVACRHNNFSFGYELNSPDSGRNEVQWHMHNGSTIRSGEPNKGLHIAGLRVDGNDSEYRIDGTQVGAGDVGSNDLRGLRIGGSGNNNNAAVDIVEYLVYEQGVSDSTPEIEQYLDRHTEVL
jgi:hypothetical protein